ncbi:hypothetical protein DYB25_013905 [Aphanomyces astaci]|uniref:NodB homology domain-containing protein n=1 Tax=Aphanomyces astaci TaxID=112090 RepID=A0A397C3K3_APHAT|nr:hypothetical protein DYB25_013905 [Aphanomyces astaci]
MFGFLVVWSVAALFVFGPSSHKENGEQGEPDGLPDSERSSDSDRRWPSVPDVPVTTVAVDIPLLNDTMAPPSKVKFSFPKFVGHPAKFPIPTAPTCGIRKAKSAKEVVYMTVDDGPSQSGRLNLLNAMDQLNNRKNKEAAYVTFIESGYNFCDLDSNSILNLKCNSTAYDTALQLVVWTIKAGHMIAAHSDSHFYDANAGICNYVTMPLVTKVEDKYAKCGNDTWSDMVRGALRIEEALANETLWETDADRAAHKRAVSTLWSYARLPCTNVAGESSETGLFKEVTDRDARLLTADKLFEGKLECKPDTKPWLSMGWDAEWRLDAKATYDAQKEKCKVAQDIVNHFDNKGKAGPREDHVVLLTHDYFFADEAKASIFRDVVAELQMLGYTIGTLDQYPLKQ